MHIVLAGLDRLPGDEHERLHVVADATRPADLADVVQPLLAEQPVLVLHPTWDPETRRAVDSLHMALDTPALLRCGIGLAPVAASAVGGLLAGLADHVDEPAVLMAGLPRLTNRVLAAALLGSVTHLEHLSASLGQHVTSWLPRGPIPRDRRTRRSRRATRSPRARATAASGRRPPRGPGHR